uniref:Protein phosphatase 1 regulatory subunit 21 n=1 Tax=Cyprinus carpio TaxID=7962 RepID=A0A8C2GBY8_CYPCA
MANVTDLQSKYSKLAQEYSKLRAQNQVLKKAVVDEQTASCSLKDELKQKEQSLRKVEQEMDSLSFRNQQLTKRVELLQEELLLSESKSKKSKNKGDSPSQVSLQTQSVFDEDLQKKIQENERLHIQFHEADEQFRRQEAQLRVRLDQLEKESEQHQAVVDALNRKYTDAIEKLQNDKALLEVNAQTLEREAKDCRIRTEECQQQLRKYQSEVSSQLKHSSSVIQEKVPFNDTQLSDYNSLNVPLHNRRHQLKARDVAAQALGFVQSLVSALLNLHSYTEQRVHIYPLDSSIEAISPVNLKFSQYLHENASYLRPLEEDLLQLHHSITEDSITALKLCTTNECLLSSLASLTNSCGKMATFFSNNLDFLASCPGYGPRGGFLNPQQADSVMENKRRAATYMSTIRKSESVPYREALANRHVLTSSTESREGLMQQVYEQTHLRTSVCVCVCVCMCVCVCVVDSREHLIKHHYMSRVSEITAQLQMCDSKAVHFHAECRAVAKRLAMAEKSRETLTEELKVAHQNITRLQDELSTTKRSYEDQLSMMSDHLCSMNDTLSKQRDEIDSLKKQNKKNKK